MRLWGKVLDWMDAPEEVIKRKAARIPIEGSASAGAAGLASRYLRRRKARLDGIKTGHQGTTSTERTFRRRGLAQVIREIAGSELRGVCGRFPLHPKRSPKGHRGRKSKRRPKPAFGL